MDGHLRESSIYETTSGSIEVRLERGTVWLSQEQIAALFDVQKAAVSKHLKNIFASGELERSSTVSKMETVGCLIHKDTMIRLIMNMLAQGI